jgi:hypothetical protein
VIATERVLFDGRLGTQRVRVWVRAKDSDIAMLSHDIGPDVERFFGTDDLETILEVDDAHLSRLTAALRDDAVRARRAEPLKGAAVPARWLHNARARFIAVGGTW